MLAPASSSPHYAYLPEHVFSSAFPSALMTGPRHDQPHWRNPRKMRPKGLPSLAPHHHPPLAFTALLPHRIRAELRSHACPEAPLSGGSPDAEGQGEGRSGVCQGLSHLVRTLPPPPPLFPLFLGFLPQRPVFSHLSFPEAQSWGAGGPQMPIDCLVRCPSPVLWVEVGEGKKTQNR